jgi:hypothetical protein
MGNRLIKILLGIGLVAIAAVGFLVKHGASQPQPQKTSTYSPPVVNAEPSQSVTQDAPDGKASLTMKAEKVEGGISYTVLTTGADKVQKEVFKKKVTTGTVISIPFNTFSPNDKYLFLKEVSPENTSFFVLATNGDPLKGGAQTIDFTGLFTAKYPDNKIKDVTGWGGLTLIVINTEKNGETGSSFWFDVSSASFIQLSTKF